VLDRLPLRWRLVVATLVGTIAFAIGFGALAVFEIERLEQHSISTALQERIDLVRPQVQEDGSLGELDHSPRTNIGQVVGPDGGVRDATPSLVDQKAVLDVARVRAHPAGVQGTVELNHSKVVVRGIPVQLAATPSSPAGTGALIVGLESEGFETAGHQLREILLAGLAVVVPLAGLLAWLLAGRALRTVSELTEEAEAVGLSDIGRGLDVAAGDPELARLVAALDRMLARVAAGLERERRFAADASHRLRTPLATLRAEAELALLEGDRNSMAEALRRVIDDADDLGELVNRLLAAHTSRRSQPVAVADALASACERWERQVTTSGARLATDLSRLDDDGRTVDPHLLRTVIDPLVENAAQHGSPDGQVTVSAAAQDGSLVVLVTDDGPGIDPDIRERLFQPWVTSREERGGAGLGLWLSQEAARAVGGDVSLTGAPVGTTCFEVRLPLSGD
jgi:two-component system OmpR family sensor kinase